MHNTKKEREGHIHEKADTIHAAGVGNARHAAPLGLIDTAEAATGAQILTPTSGTSGTGANGGTWECSSAGDTLTLTNYNGYPIETDATTIRFSGTNTITVPLSNLSGALRVYGLKLTSTRNIEIYGEDGSSLNIVFKPGSGAEDVDVSGIDADGPLLINTAGDITISAPYGYPYGIRARQGLDYSGTGALDITVKGSYFIKSQHWCAAYGIAAEKGAISLSGSGSKTIRVQSSATPRQISSTPYGIYHGGGTDSSGTATVSVDTGALHIEMNGDGYGIYNMGSADRAYVNINNVPELSIEKADSAIATAHTSNVNVRNSKLRIANGRYAMQVSGGTVNMENADVTAAVRGSSAGYTDAAVHTGTLQVKGSSTVDMTATYGTVVYARDVSVNLSNGSFTAKTGQSKWPPIDAPVTLGAKTRLMTGVCSDADAGKYAGEKVDDLYVTSFASVESGTCGENVNWTLDADGTLTISGTGAMANYNIDDDYAIRAPWYGSLVKTVIIKNGVTSIGDYAFHNSRYLTSVTIPASVTSIGNHAFHNCPSLTSVTIPASVTSIGISVFNGCESLTSVTIPNGVTSIGGWMFYGCSSLTRVTIPNSVTSIGNSVFEDCTSLTSVTIPNSVTSIGYSAFSGCSALTDVYYDGYGIDWLALGRHSEISNSATVHFKDNLYDKGTCGTNVNWVMTGDGTLTISGKGRISNYDYNNSAPWAKCSAYIKCVVIKPGVRGIGDYAFHDCSSLTSVTIPNSVTIIGSSAFYGCSSLTSVTIPNSVTSIEICTFSSCTSLTHVTIPNSVTSIGVLAFEYCKSLTSVTIPNSVTSIGVLAFKGCTSLKSVTIPNSVTSIEYYAFEDCSSLTRVTIPNSVTSIGSWAFSGCSALTSVTIPNSVTGIGGGAFENCTSLTSVKLPSALQWIDPETFSNCTALTSVTIPKSVTGIGEKAFYYCDSLTDVYYGGTKADWKKITIKTGNEDLQNAKLHTGAVFAPDDVTLSSAKAVNGGIQVTWKEAAGVAKYRVFRKGPGETKWTGIANVTGASYTDQNVKAGVTYSYTVRGISEDGVFSADYNRIGLSATAAPANVKLTGATAVNGGIQVTWQAADGAAQYRVYRKDAANTGWTVLTSSATGTSFLDKTAKAGVKYTYTVRGIAADGKTLSPGHEPGVSAMIPKSAAPAIVKLTGAKEVNGGIQVAWQKANGAAKYRVYRKDAVNTGWTVLTSSATGTSFVDKTAVAGVTYTYTVRGVAKDGKTLSPDYNRTGVSATMPKTSTAPATVKLVGAKAVSGGIQVTWQKAAGAAQYRVYRKDATNTKWTALTSSATGTSYTDKTAKAGVKYTYTVRGIAKDGKTLSPDYNKTGVSATIPKTTVSSVPAEVKMKDVTASGSYIKVNWERAANASAYRVYRRINNNTDWHVVASSVNGTSYTDRNVEPGVRYSYTVRGIASDGKTLSKTYDRVGDFAFARISADTLANDSVLKIFPIADVPYNLTRINWDYLQYYYKGNSIEQLPSEFGGKLRLLFNNDGTVYLVTGNGVGRGVYSADELVISIVFPGSDIPQVYVATFTRLDKYTYLHLMPDISGREALVFGAMSQR